MFVSERFLYIDLQKTGSTHIRNVLAEVVGGEFRTRHSQPPEELLRGGRVVLGSVRDPWEWYTSLWAFGCDRRGAVHRKVTRRKFRGLGWRNRPARALRRILASPHREWASTYTHVDDVEAFRKWLHLMHDPDYRHDLPQDYGNSSLTPFAGLMTYRYLLLFCTPASAGQRLRRLASYEEIERYAAEKGYVDRFIRAENLADDLLSALEDNGVEIAPELRSEIRGRPRTNASSRKLGPTHFYDAATEKIVAERERLLIERFGYVRPSERPSADTDPAG